MVCVLLITYSSLFSQIEKECKGNIDLNAFFERVSVPPDTTTTKKQVHPLPSGLYCPEGTRTRDQYRLRVSNDAFTVISFTIMVETPEDDIAEISNQGEYLQRSAFMMIVTRKRSEPVYLSCIKVQHTSGTIRILKPFSISTTTF